MKHLISILIVLLIVGCGQTKEIRRTERANKKLDKLVDKFPELNRKDTVQSIVTYTVKETKIDTVFELETDTVYKSANHIVITHFPPKELKYEKEGAVLSLKRIDSGKSWRYEMSAIIPEKRIEIPIEVYVDRIGPTKYTPYPLSKKQVFFIGLGQAIMWFLIVAIIVIIIRIAIKFNKPI